LIDVKRSARIEAREVAVNKLRVVLALVFRPSAIVVVFLLAALVLAGAISAGSGGSYKGKTKEGFAVSFRVSGSNVTGFKLAGNASCVAWHSTSGEIGAFKASKKGRLKAGGKFAIDYAKHTLHVQVNGRVSGSSASGRAKFHYAKSMGGEVGTCWVKTTWKAKRTG
jgi:hypothetical protein